MLDYDASTGLFSRKHGHVCNNGTNTLGYVQIMVDGQMCAGHRLAWLYVHGRWPADQLDHINGNRADNRIANLRESSQAENCGNVARHRDNRSGYKGVFSARDKWAAQICRNGVKRHLGVFDSPEAAHKAYCAAALETFGQFARVA